MDLVPFQISRFCQFAEKQVTETSSDAMAAFERHLGYEFKDKDLLRRALIHSSYGDGRNVVRDNERLEFLGDRVLGLLASQFLFDADQRFEEGEMAPRLNELVRKETCARAARRANIGKVLLLSKSEEKSGGRDKTKILGDACEAILAALYLDGGREAANRFFSTFWKEELENADGAKPDPKSQLQEWAQGKGDALPLYTLLQRSGPDHAPEFLIEVKAGGLTAQGKANNKQEAERTAARNLLKMRTKT
jgi:ribonuclease III